MDNENRWVCDKCSHSVRSHKKTLLFKTSDILIILLKRYSSNLRKNNKFIKYPINLQLQDFNKNYGTNKSNTYTLNGFCMHGGSLGGGHYYAVSKNNLDQKWYVYDDLSVNEIGITEVLKYTPYLFFYKRV